MLFPLIVSSTQHLAGDVAPLGDPDGQLNVADVLILERFILSQVSPTAEELLVTDVAPLGAPDGLLNAADLVVLQRAALGLISLPDINIGAMVPVLFPAPSPTGINPCPVHGLADPGMELRIYINGQPQPPVFADETGAFRFYAPLQAGANALYVTAWDGIQDSDASNTLMVDFVYTPPTAVHGGPYSGAVDFKTWFDGSGSFDRYTHGLTYHWDFGDGSTGTGAQPAHRYATAGSHVVTLTVSANGETSDPVATTATIKETVVLDISSSLASSNSKTLTNEKVHVVPETQVLPQLGRLIIEAGTELRFSQFARLDILGSLEIKGSANNPVVLTSLDDRPGRYAGQWGGLWLTEYSNATIDHAVIEGAKDAITIFHEGSDVVIRNSLLQKNDVGILMYADNRYLRAVRPLVKGNTLREGGSAVLIYGDARPQIIAGNIIRQNDTGMHLVGDRMTGNPRPVLDGNSIDHNWYMNYLANITYPEQTLLLDANDNWWGTDDRVLINRQIRDSRDESNRATVNISRIKTFPLDDELLLDPVYDETIDKPYTIKGTAPAGAELNIYASAADVYFAGTVTADADGRFSIDYIFPEEGHYSFFARRVENGREVEESEWTMNRIYYIPTPWWNDIPVINTVSSPTSLNPVTISIGSDLYFQEANLYVNGVLRASSSQTGYEDITFDTVLDVGTNTIHATYLTPDGESAPSRPIVVDYIPDGSLSTYSGGAVSSDLVLPPQPEPYQISADIEIGSSAKLTVLAGAVLEFSHGTRIIAEGELNILGESGNLVKLRSSASNPSPGDWVGIEIPAGSNRKTRIEHALIEHASVGVWFNGGSATVDHSILKNNYYGFYIDAGAEPVISNNTIQGNSVGLWVTAASSPIIYPHNTIANNTQGINLVGTRLPGGNPVPVIHENNIFGNTSIDLLADDFFDAQAVTIDARGNWWGTASSFSIDSQIFDSHDNLEGSPTVDYLPVQSAKLSETSPLTPKLDLAIRSTSASTYTLNGSSEPNREIHLYLNDNLEMTLSSDAEGRFSQTVPLVQGSNTLYAIAVNGTEQSLPYLTYTVDSDVVSPHITLTTPVEDEWVGYATFIGQLDEAAMLTINGEAVTVNPDNSFVHVLAGLPQGLNVVELIATDMAGNRSSLHVSFTLDNQPPGIPDIGQITIGNPHGGQVTVTAPAGNVTAGDTVILINTRTGETLQATANGDGSYALPLGAQAGDDIVILIKDPVGNTTASRILQVAGTVPALGLIVVSPPDGSTVNESHVGVSGTFQGTANVGITVNGNWAQIIDSTFCAGNVSLVTGNNQLDVVATTADGESITQTLTVNNTGSSLVELAADAEAGYAPHTATFSLSDNTGVSLATIEYDVDGDGMVDYTTSDPRATFQHTYILPGCYTATVTVTDSMSGIYTSSRTIAVTRADRQIARLRSVYYQLLDDLRRGDIPSAVQAFTVTSQERFDSLFTEMQPTLATLADSLGTITRTQIGGDIGEIIVRREKNGMPYVYSVNFIRSESGLWRIEDM
jgi:parallel beta-helix repeat protein